MKDFLKKNGRNSILVSILLVVLSLFLIFSPNTSLKIIMMALGIVLAINGIFHMVSYFSATKELKMFSFELTLGVISLIIGLIFIFNPDIINTFLSIIIGGWIILQSISSIELAMNMKDSTSHWFVLLIISIVTLLIGVVLLFNPFAGTILVTACGMMLLIFEIINIAETSVMMYYIK